MKPKNRPPWWRHEAIRSEKTRAKRLASKMFQAWQFTEPRLPKPPAFTHREIRRGAAR